LNNHLQDNGNNADVEEVVGFGCESNLLGEALQAEE
jgi:hypothetical protein